MGFSEDLDLQDSQLIHIAKDFCKQVTYGMGAENGDIKCLPAFIPVSRSVRGRALILDLGGTRLRAAVANVDGRGMTLEKGPLEDTLPLKRGTPLEKSIYLKIQTDLIKRLDPEPGLPLGYCFSYPTASERDGDARLIRWTKGVRVPGVEGENVGRMLMDALAREGISCSRCVVLNDTTASLMAGLSQQSGADAHIGLVVGTGTNTATLVPKGSLPKLENGAADQDRIPVNLESGNFFPPNLTRWDEQVDRESDNPGLQRLEKAVSGAYLARLMKVGMPKEAFDVSKGAALLSDWVHSDDPDHSGKKEPAAAILTRSARLVASSLAGLLLFLNRQTPVHTVTIVAEGGLILKAPGYKDTVEKTLSTLVRDLELPTRGRDLIHIPHANLLGSAWAALSS